MDMRDVTLEEVTMVADKLLAAGVEPALRAIRDRLGAGSTDTIMVFLEEWRRIQESRAVEDLAVSRASEDRLRSELAHQTQLASEHCAAIVPLKAEHDSAVVALAKAVLRLEYVSVLESATESLRADRDRECRARTKAEQELAVLAKEMNDLREQLKAVKAHEPRRRAKHPNAKTRGSSPQH